MSETKAQKKPVGRPTKYYEALGAELIESAKKGLSLVEFASLAGTNHETLLDYVQKYPDFSESYKTAKGILAAWYLERGKIVAFGGQDETLRVDARYAKPQIFSLIVQNLLGWRVKTDVTSNNETIVGPTVYVPGEKDGDA